MFQRIPALAVAFLLPLAASAQSTTPPKALAGPPAATDEHDGKDLPQKIREKLTADGFKDVKVTPSSFVVSAKDKHGHPVTMLIGPTGMTVIATPDTPDPSTAQRHDTPPETYQE